MTAPITVDTSRDLTVIICNHICPWRWAGHDPTAGRLAAADHMIASHGSWTAARYLRDSARASRKTRGRDNTPAPTTPPPGP